MSCEPRNQTPPASAVAPVDARNVAIGVLSVTGTILFSALVLLESRPATVLASGMTATAGEYLLTVGTDVAPDEELLYVLDAPSERLIAYRFDPVKKEIQIVQGIELDKFRGGQPSPGQPAPNQPPAPAPRRP